jgi:hypothetical protein
MSKTVKIDVSPYVAKLLTIEATYLELSRIELANKIIMDAISQRTKDYVGPEEKENDPGFS